MGLRSSGPAPLVAAGSPAAAAVLAFRRRLGHAVTGLARCAAATLTRRGAAIFARRGAAIFARRGAATLARVQSGQHGRERADLLA